IEPPRPASARRRRRPPERERRSHAPPGEVRRASGARRARGARRRLRRLAAPLPLGWGRLRRRHPRLLLAVHRPAALEDRPLAERPPPPLAAAALQPLP